MFTGLNNFRVYTIKDVQYNEYFGFSDMEVRELLYGFTEKYDVIKKWYDGYCFGKLEVYCPWDVVSYCHDLRIEASTEPRNFAIKDAVR